ncbi:MAG: glycosyltransferase [Chloroflexi bacterium]|nr:glycosyltransferase [Chloroflexota bacterium]
MKKPSISVVVPLYNKEKHINRCLDSILSQSFQDFEIVVVNDGSTDDSKKRVIVFPSGISGGK